MEFTKTWSNNYGCTFKVDTKGLYHQFCSSCGASEKDHTKQWEKGYMTRTIYTICKCGAKYEYVS